MSTYEDLINAKYEAQKQAALQAQERQLQQINAQRREIGPYYEALLRELERKYTQGLRSTEARTASMAGLGGGSGSFIGALIDVEAKMGEQYNWQRQYEEGRKSRQLQSLQEQENIIRGQTAANLAAIQREQDLTLKQYREQLAAEAAARAAAASGGGGSGLTTEIQYERLPVAQNKATSTGYAPPKAGKVQLQSPKPLFQRAIDWFRNLGNRLRGGGGGGSW